MPDIDENNGKSNKDGLDKEAVICGKEGQEMNDRNECCTNVCTPVRCQTVTRCHPVTCCVPVQCCCSCSPGSGMFNQKVTIVGNYFINDSETVGNDETETGSITNSVILNMQNLPQTVMDLTATCGGEVRVVLHVNIMLADQYGNVSITGSLKLFEGTNETTTDLDGETPFNLYLPNGGLLNHVIDVINEQEHSNDSSKWVITATNTSV